MATSPWIRPDHSRKILPPSKGENSMPQKLESPEGMPLAEKSIMADSYLQRMRSASGCQRTSLIATILKQNTNQTTSYENFHIIYIRGHLYLLFLHRAGLRTDH
jgi:hypothetical protein